ncbi:hypothetical protein AAF712_001190 [Marasmius tenuissimus]|uniref:Sulphur transport domain-containing protein n=1 Tax=Marasmius tenuissimus TaxID=585030 RepID=A0ABR3AEE3_9AGAR
MPPLFLPSFLGGIGLSLPAHALMVLNGNIFGISGFVHRTLRSDIEGMFAVLGLVSGGLVAGVVEGAHPEFCGGISIPLILGSGFLVGLGSKLANGCTSGHMICGISRLAKRSIAATMCFFAAAAPVARWLHSSMPPVDNNVPSFLYLGAADKTLLALQGPPLLLAAALYLAGPTNRSPFSKLTRLLTFWSTSFGFSLALRLSRLVECNKVLGFLLLPDHPAFDPSLAFLALGALPSSIFLYHHARSRETPKLGDKYCIPEKTDLSARLLWGAAIFGVGWGIAGVCPGPALVNLGRAIATGVGWENNVAWLAAFVVGGLVAPS